MSSVVHVDNKAKDILIFGEEPTQGLDDTTLTTEAIYPINFTQPNKIFVLSLHCSGSSSFSFVNAKKIYPFKAKNSEIKDYALCLGNISKIFTINNIKKVGLKEVVKFFADDFNPVDNNHILDIHKYLMKKKEYKIMFWLIKKRFIGLLTGLINGSNHPKCRPLSSTYSYKFTS